MVTPTGRLSVVLNMELVRSLVLISAVFSSAYSAAVKRDVGNGERHQVIIVGAGVSGYTAAAFLLENNVTDVLVLEASNRIGGRIHTVQFGGVPIDKGAEFVHGEVDNAVFELVSPHDFLKSYTTLLKPDMFLYTNTSGHVFNSSLVTSLIDQGLELLGDKEIASVNGSVADYFFPRLDKFLEEKHVDPYLREALRFALPLSEAVYSSSESLADLGARGSYEYTENEGDLLWKWKTGGYKTIFDILSKKFPNASKELPVNSKIVFNKQVTKIERKSGEVGVEVKCVDGSRYLADHVIVTTSLGVLKKHAATMFEPPLPADKTAAIEALGFGSVGKVFVLFPTRWWPADINVIVPLFSQQELQDFQNSTRHGHWSSRTTGFSPVMNHERMLCVWFSGQTCRDVEALSDQEVTDGLMELLNKLVGQKYDIPSPEAILRTNWASNPLTLGSYSYRSVASDSQNLNNTILAQPITDDKGVPVILFAGEATHPHYFSTVHGALRTGLREAHRIIAYLNDK